MNKKLYVKINNLHTNFSFENKLKVDLSINGNKKENQSISYPFTDYAHFELEEISVDKLLTLTFHMTVSNTQYQVNKYELKMSPKLLSKEMEKNLELSFLIEKPTSALIVDTAEPTVTLKLCLIIIEEGSTLEKSFLLKNESKKVNLNEMESEVQANYESLKNELNINGEITINTNNLNTGNIADREIQTEDKVNQEAISSVENQNISEISGMDKELDLNEANELSTIKAESPMKIKLKSKVLRKSLKIDLNAFTYNSNCRRCNYMERIVIAQQKDIQTLQNQIECFLKGNYTEPLGNKNAINFNMNINMNMNMESEFLLNSEPYFNKIFSEYTDKLVSNSVKNLS